MLISAEQKNRFSKSKTKKQKNKQTVGRGNAQDCKS